MTIRIFLFCFLSMAFFAKTSAQELLTIHKGCHFDGDDNEREVYGYAPSNEAQQIISRITSVMGLNQNFIIKSANVANALATTEGKQRYILYSTSFLENFKGAAQTKWAAYCVIAHEIGHHLNNDDFDESDSKRRKLMELGADRFAGNILFKMGASLEEAQAGINTFSLNGETNTHPSKSARLEAVAVGWKQAQEIGSPTSGQPKNEKPIIEDVKPERVDLPNGSKVAYKALFSSWPTNENEHGKCKPSQNWNGYDLEAFSNTWVSPGRPIALGNAFNSDFIYDVYFKVLEGTPSFEINLSDDGQNYSTIDLYFNLDDYSYSLSEGYLKNNFYKSTAKTFTAEREKIDSRIVSKFNPSDINKMSFSRVGSTVKFYLNGYLLNSFEPYYINFQKISISTAFKSKVNITTIEVKVAK